MIYLIYGSNQEMLADKEIKKIIKAAGVEVNELTQQVYFLDETPIENIIDECLTPSFFVEQKFVIVKNAYIFQNEKKTGINHNFPILEKYLESPSSFTTLIFVVNGVLDEKKDITQKLKKAAQWIKIDNVEKDDWPVVINQLIQQFKIEIDEDAKKEFIDRTSGDLTLITCELRKLRLYGDKITLEDVKKLVPAKLEDKMFEMVDSILNNDVSKTLKIYHDLKILNEDPVRLISVLASQFRFLYEVAYLAYNGMSNDEIAKQFNGVKSGRIYYTLKKFGNHELNDILYILDELASLDSQIKSGDIDKYRAFELFLVKDH